MGKKQKWSGNRPVMFFQPGIDPDPDVRIPTGNRRVRILYPDGTAEVSFLFGQKSTSPADDVQFFGCCWNRNSHTSLKKAVRAANKFDRGQGFPKMEFLGEL
jgi:hypothetical protein